MDNTEGAKLLDYSQYMALLLPLGGAALQYFRAYSVVKERYTMLAAVAIAVIVYVLCMDWTSLPAGAGAIQKAILDALVWLGPAVASVLGGTFAASKAASAGLAIIPVTNSK